MIPTVVYEESLGGPAAVGAPEAGIAALHKLHSSSECIPDGALMFP